jgi:hypothetical protein
VFPKKLLRKIDQAKKIQLISIKSIYMTRTYFLPFILLIGVVAACTQGPPSTQTQIDSQIVSAVAGTYGAEIIESNVLTAGQLVEEVTKKGSFEGKISGQIKEVCASKGCWLTMDLPSGESMRVTFKDYGFFVPTNSAGFPLVLEGKAILTETDVETLRHFAEDAGKSKEEVEAITASKKEITFEAEGVVIKEKA